MKLKPKTSSSSATVERALFLKSLREDGIDEIYLGSSVLAKKQSARSNLESLKSSSVATASPVSPPRKNVKVGETMQSQNPVRDQLLQLREKALKCTLCGELASTRKNVVFGAGNIKAKLMFVGEAPGRDEDTEGLPFVGRAGQLLTKIIESIGFDRKQVFIANVLKCRPPENRQPQPDEISNCQPYLSKQIELIRPKIICALGTFAAQTLLKSDQTISRLRGQFHDYPGFGIKVICTFHPAYLLRNPDEKRKVWEDMKTIKKELEKSE